MVRASVALSLTQETRKQPSAYHVHLLVDAYVRVHLIRVNDDILDADIAARGA